MANQDKIIAAFLVSMGLFSVAQANQYVGALSQGEKSALIDVQEIASSIDADQASSCYIDGSPCQGGNK